jgi:chemotaxis signal transduction protein
LRLTEAPLQLHDHIILSRLEGRLLGLIVDQVVDVCAVSTEQIKHLTEMLPVSLRQSQLVIGVLRTKRDMVMLLDLNQLFSLECLDLPDFKLQSPCEIDPKQNARDHFN